MTDSWTYEELRPLRPGRPHQFLQELFGQLYLWSKSVTENHEEFPAGFTEWTVAGHFAVAASQPPLRCFTSQEFSVKLTNTPRRKGKTRVRRPDLHLRQEDWRNACMFEFKREFIPLVPTARRDFAKSILELVKDAHGQLMQVSSANYADLLCSTVGMTIWLDYVVNGKDRWAGKWEYEKVYASAWDELLYERIVPALQEQADSLEAFGRTYYCGYRMPHSLTDTHHVWREAEWADHPDKDKQHTRTFPIGMLWFLAVQEWRSVED